MVKQALALPFFDIQFNERSHKDEHRYLCMDVLEPRWDQLKQQIIRLPLQIYMQFFHFAYPHRWSVLEKSIAVEFTLKQEFNRHMRKDFALGVMTRILRASKSTTTKGSSGMNKKMRPYLGGVLVLTRIAYAALEVNEFLKPEKVDIGTKTVPGSWPSKSNRSKTLKSSKKGRPSKKSDTQKAQSQKSPPRQEDELDNQELQDAIELSKSDGTGMSKTSHSKFINPKTRETDEERSLREAIRRSLADVSGKATSLPNIFTCLEEGNHILMHEEAEQIRETLIALSQDIGAIISLHEAITMFRQEGLQRDKAL